MRHELSNVEWTAIKPMLPNKPLSARGAVGGAAGPAERRPCGDVRDRPGDLLRDRPGISAFVLDDGAIYHTYSTFSRGLDGIWGMYPWLDRAPKGRNETGGAWWRRHDEYDKR